MMNRKTLTVFAVIIAAFITIPPLTARADVLIEPENNFYENYADYCIGLGRSFVANGESGSVGIKRSPSAASDIAMLQNGETIYVQYSCLYAGEYWGLTGSVSGNSESRYGWVNLGEMLVVYDYVSFEEEHIDELYEHYLAMLDDNTVSTPFQEAEVIRSLVIWTWPGSGVAYSWSVADIDAKELDSALLAYKDEQGREWGFFTYLYGARNIWICLSEPENRDIPAFNPPKDPATWEPGTEHTEIPAASIWSDGETDVNVIILITAAVTGLVALTLVLIKLLYKPRN